MPVVNFHHGNALIANYGFSDIASNVYKLFAFSTLHSSLPSHLIDKVLYPSIECDQFLLVLEKGMPIGFCSWALLNDVESARYMSDPYSLNADAWHSGQYLWIIDFVVNPGYMAANQLFFLAKQLLARFPFAFSLRVKFGSSEARVMIIRGPAANKEWKIVAEQSIRDFFLIAKYVVPRNDDM